MGYSLYNFMYYYNAQLIFIIIIMYYGYHCNLSAQICNYAVVSRIKNCVTAP